MARHYRYLFAVLAVLVLPPAAQAGNKQELSRLSVDFRTAPLEDALRVLFRGTPYTFELGPGLDCEITVSVQNVEWVQALRAVLNTCQLTYTKRGKVYHISTPASAPPAEPPAEPAPSKSRHTMLYLNREGDKIRLCLREFPYPGYERVLWSGSEDTFRYYQPSPSFDRVLVARGREHILVEVPGGEPSWIDVPGRTLLWKDRLTLLVLDVDPWQGKAVEGTYSLTDRTLTPIKTGSSYTDLLDEQFADEVKAFTAPDRKRTLSSLALPVLGPETLPRAVLSGKGIGRRSERSLPVAAASPDRMRFAVTSGRDAVFVIARSGPEVYSVQRTLLPVELFKTEGVWFEDLRWSPDSKYLTFTERHFCPARHSGPDIGRNAGEPRNEAALVRLYDPARDELQTVVGGEDAFLAAEGIEFHPGW